MDNMSSKDFRFGISSNVQGVDLNQLLVRHALSTYFMRIDSDMPELNLFADDIAVVDRSLRPKSSDIIVVSEEADSQLKVVRFGDLSDELQFWGVAVHIIRRLRA